MNRSTCTSELSMKNMFSEKINIHVSLGSIVNTQACCVNIFACEHLTKIILRPLSVLSLDEIATRCRRPIYFSVKEQNLQLTPCFSFFHKSYFLCLSSISIVKSGVLARTRCSSTTFCGNSDTCNQ
jgi:hypothetical protein